MVLCLPVDSGNLIVPCPCCSCPYVKIVCTVKPETLASGNFGEFGELGSNRQTLTFQTSKISAFLHNNAKQNKRFCHHFTKVFFCQNSLSQVLPKFNNASFQFYGISKECIVRAIRGTRVLCTLDSSYS